MGKPRILVFGRTGSGKSTVANMLARGHLDPPLLFQTSSGARGQTLNTQTEECEDMVIVDTVGLGESDLGSVSHQEAENILYKFFLELEGGFHYFAFVRKWSRNDALDEQLWGFFRQAFKGAEQNFVVIFTGVGKFQEKELEKPETKEALLKLYHPCQRWIFVNFGGELRKKVLKRSLTNLQAKLSEIRGPALAPEVCKQMKLMKLGRILLMGRREEAKGILANMLDRSKWQVVDFEFNKLVSYTHDRMRELLAMVLETLMEEKGFSHFVLVHESGHDYEHGQVETELDKMWWKMMLALFNERLMVVIARDSQQDTSFERAMIESSWFPGCQKLVHLDLPFMQQLPQSSGVSSRPKSDIRHALQIFEQALQIQQVDTKSTFFHLERLSDIDMHQIIQDLLQSYVLPSVGDILPGMIMVDSPLSELSSAYRNIVNQSDIPVQTQQMSLTWKEGDATATEYADFCESRQLVIGERHDFRYLTMKCKVGGTVEGIHVRVEYEDKSGHNIDSNNEESISEAQLAVLAPDSHTEIGERISVYTNHSLDRRMSHSITITESSFVKNIRAHHDITLFLHSKPGWWCSYTFHASLRLFRG